MASPYTYEEMKRRQAAVGETGPAGPVEAEQVTMDPPVSIDETPAEVDSATLNTPAIDTEDPTIPLDMGDGAPAESTRVAVPASPPRLDEKRGKRAVVFNALRNSQAGIEQYAEHIRRQYKVPRDFKATPSEIINAGLDLTRQDMPDMTAPEYIKALHEVYGPKVDRALLEQAKADYPGHNDDDSLIDEMYKRKIAREESAPLTWADKASIIARRFPELHKSDKDPEKALKIVYDAQKKKGKDVGSFDDWTHTQMAPTLGEMALNLGPAAARGLGAIIKDTAVSTGRLGQELLVPGQANVDVATALTGGDSQAAKDARERLKQAGEGAVNVAALAAGPAVKAGLMGLEAAGQGARVAPAFARGVLEGAAVGGLQGGGTAAVQGQKPLDVLQATGVGAGLGATIGGAGEQIHANKMSAEAAKAAVADEAAKEAGAGAVGAAAVAPEATVPRPAPATTLDAVAQHQAEQNFNANVRSFATKHGMDVEDAFRLVTPEEPNLTDLASAAAKGIQPADVAALRATMPEHLGGAPPPFEGVKYTTALGKPAVTLPPRPKYVMTPEEQAAWDAKQAEYLKNGPSPDSPYYEALKREAENQGVRVDEPRAISDQLAALERVGDRLPPEERLKYRQALATAREQVNAPGEGLAKEVPAAGPAATPPAAPTARVPAATAAPASVPEKGLVQSPMSEKLAEAYKRASVQVRERARMRRQQLSAKFAAGEAAAKLHNNPLLAMRARLGAMAGELKRPEWDGVKDLFNDIDLEHLRRTINDSSMLTGDKLTATAALDRLFFGGKMGGPTKSQLAALRLAFGDDFAGAVEKDPTVWSNLWKRAIQPALNTPRTAMTTLDISLGLRQGYLMTSRPEFGRAWVQMVKAFGSDKVAQASVERIKANPLYDIERASKLFFQGKEFGGQKGEQFAGSLIDNVPLVKNSARAADTFANEIRENIFSGVYNDLAEAGVDVSDVHFRKSLAHWINTGTGRGNLGKLEGAADVLNSFLFSPRLAWSRVETFNPGYYAGMHPAVRSLAWRANAKTVGATMSLLGALSMSGAATVGWDPRSSDFAKAKFGNTRIDLLGGHQQLVRTMAQLVTGKVISSTTGREIDLNGSDLKNGFARGGMTRLDVLGKFMEAKSAPIASLIQNQLRGTDFMGRPISISNELLTRMTPMVVEDLFDAYQQSGPGVAAGAGPSAILGLGVQSYGPSLPVSAGGSKGVQEGVAMNIGRRLWNHVNGIAPDRDMKYVTGTLANQWVKDAAMAQVMGQQEATKIPGFFEKGFDQKTAIRKAQAKRMAKVNKLYKDLSGGNGEAARVAAQSSMLQRRAEVTGMDIEALKNPNIMQEVTK